MSSLIKNESQRTSSITSCPQVGSPREAHVSQQNEGLGNEVSRLQPISDARSPPAQETRSPLDLRATSSRGARLQGGGTTETPESQPIEALPQRKRNVWTESELGRLANLVKRHRTANGGVQWAELGSAWESLRSAQDLKRTVSALKAAYAKQSKRTRQTDHTADSDGLADLGIPSTQSCPQADSQMEAHVSQQNEGLGNEVARLQPISDARSPPAQETRSPLDLRATSSRGARLQGGGTTETLESQSIETLPRRKRNVWAESELGRLANLVERHWTANGGVQWAELGSAWKSSRNTQDPKRTVKALQAAYAKLTKVTERAESIVASEDPAERRTPSRDLRSTWDCSRMENDPRRTLSALKAKYAKIARLTDRNEAPRSYASNSVHEDEEQPAESNVGESVTLVDQEHTTGWAKIMITARADVHSKFFLSS
uniref:Myb-like domain-containing protein n=1 Tax=Haemonchus contortus TaxID=6289 RepID=A0A7I5E7H5_HAECO